MCLSESDFAVMLCLDPTFFFFPQVQTCGFLTGISQKKTKKKHTKRIQTKRQDSPSPSQTQTITNMTYQSPVQWSRTKDPLFMEHFLFGAFSGLLCVMWRRGRCDSQHVGIILKQPSICQGYAFGLKVLSSLRIYCCVIQKGRARERG